MAVARRRVGRAAPAEPVHPAGPIADSVARPRGVPVPRRPAHVDAALPNPARKVTDGDLVSVGVTAAPGALRPAGGQAPRARCDAAGQRSDAPGAVGPAGQPGGWMTLNTATLAPLDTLPAVAPVPAHRIRDHRDRQGGFRSVGDLRQADGTGRRYGRLKELVTR